MVVVASVTSSVWAASGCAWPIPCRLHYWPHCTWSYCALRKINQMNCTRKHVSTGVLVFDPIGGKEHLLYGYKLRPPEGLPGWEWPGGKHDQGETIVDCAKRETLKETGLIVEVEHLTYVETPNYLCMLFTARPVDGMLTRREPTKHGEWKWFPADEPPFPLCEHTSDAIEKINNEFDFFNRKGQKAFLEQSQKV